MSSFKLPCISNVTNLKRKNFISINVTTTTMTPGYRYTKYLESVFFFFFNKVVIEYLLCVPHCAVLKLLHIYLAYVIEISKSSFFTVGLQRLTNLHF